MEQRLIYFESILNHTTKPQYSSFIEGLIALEPYTSYYHLFNYQYDGTYTANEFDQILAGLEKRLQFPEKMLRYVDQFFIENYIWFHNGRHDLCTNHKYMIYLLKNLDLFDYFENYKVFLAVNGNLGPIIYDNEYPHYTNLTLILQGKPLFPHTFISDPKFISLCALSPIISKVTSVEEQIISERTIVKLQSGKNYKFIVDSELLLIGGEYEPVNVNFIEFVITKNGHVQFSDRVELCMLVTNQPRIKGKFKVQYIKSPVPLHIKPDICLNSDEEFTYYLANDSVDEFLASESLKRNTWYTLSNMVNIFNAARQYASNNFAQLHNFCTDDKMSYDRDDQPKGIIKVLTEKTLAVDTAKYIPFILKGHLGNHFLSGVAFFDEMQNKSIIIVFDPLGKTKKNTVFERFSIPDELEIIVLNNRVQIEDSLTSCGPLSIEFLLYIMNDESLIERCLLTKKSPFNIDPAEYTEHIRELRIKHRHLLSVYSNYQLTIDFSKDSMLNQKLVEIMDEPDYDEILNEYADSDDGFE